MENLGYYYMYMNRITLLISHKSFQVENFIHQRILISVMWNKQYTTKDLNESH